MPRISVIVPTMRPGGLDVLFSGLGRQTYRDFELVLSDCLHPRRAEAAASEAFRRGLNLVHVEPRGNRFPHNFFCRCANEGIASASGEIAVLMTDYTWAPPDCLQKHASFHDDPASSRSCLMGAHSYRSMPILRRPLHYKSPDDSVYSDDSSLRYGADVVSGLLDDMMVSLFSDPFESPDGLPPDDFARDPKLDGPAGPSNSRGFYAKNDSLRLEHLLEVNGWDEAMDTSHGYQDWELADRLSHRVGLSWISDPGNVVQMVNPRRVLPHGFREAPFEHNHALWQTKVSTGSWSNPNDWTLRERVR